MAKPKAKEKPVPYAELEKLPGKLKLTTRGARIKAAREIWGLSVRALARAIGVSAASVSDWETGATDNLKNDNLFALSDFLHVRPRWIELGDCPPTALENQTPVQTRINLILAGLSDDKQDEVLKYAQLQSKVKIRA